MNAAVEIAGNIIIEFKPLLERDHCIPDTEIRSYISQEDPKLQPKILKALSRNYNFVLIKDLSGLMWMPYPQARAKLKKIVYGKEIISSEAFTKTRIRQPNYNSPFYRRLVQVYEVFSKALDDPTNTEGVPASQALPAVEFEDLLSHQTIRRVKRALGIKSFRKDGVWWWTFPKRTPMIAQQRIHDRKMMVLRRSLPHENMPMPQVRLIQIMTEHDFDCPSATALAETGYKRRSVIAAKTALHIVTIRGSIQAPQSKTRWIYPAPEVQEWIHSRLTNGSMPEAELLEEAAASTNWSPDVLQVTRKFLGIKATYSESVRYWEMI
jgi:hypothetical protein